MFHKRKSLFLACITILTSIALYNIYNNTESVFAYTASITTSGTINLNVSASGNGANVATDNISVTSTCPLGYTLSIQGPTDSTLYKDGNKTNSSTSSKIIPTMGTKTAPLPIIGEDGSGNSYLGTWGYSMTNNLATGTFVGLTNTMTELTTKSTASGDGTTTTDTIPVYYGVSVRPDIETGQYKLAESTAGAGDNVITYILTTDPACESAFIRYHDNGANSPTKMSDQDPGSGATEATLWASNFQRPGYGFAGWNTKADGTGINYGPNQTITLPSNFATSGLDLYARWIQSAGNLQGWTGCSAMTTGAVTALTDTRDNNTYAIAKLADGNCWMIENMRLGGANPINLTTSDSDVSADLTLPASTNSFITTDNTAIQVSARNTISPVSNMTSGAANVYSYGNYYSWPAAIGSTAIYDTAGALTSSSICPKGWSLSIGNNTTASGSFSALDRALGGTGGSQATAEASNRWRTYPNNFLSSGYLNGSSANSRGDRGYYWSATVNSATNSYSMSIRPANAYPGTTSFSKYYGQSVRCVIYDTVANLDTGPNINKKLKSLASGTNVTGVGTADNLITAFIRSDTLPANFTPSDANTISLSNSPGLVYVWFDSNTGVMSYYTKASIIYTNKDSRDLFFRCSALTDISGVSSWNLEKTNDIGGIFSSTGITDLTPIANWNTSNITNMGGGTMSASIYGAFTNLPATDLSPISNWDVSNVIDMEGMFLSYKGTDLSPLANWKVDNVKDMSSMFGFTKISDLTPLKDWNVGNVTYMDKMFQFSEVSALTGLEKWNVGNVTSMHDTFGKTKISDLTPIANWKVDNVKDMSYMFRSTKISDLTPLKDWKVDNVKDMSSMFDSTKISDLTPLANWNVSNVTNMSDMFNKGIRNLGSEPDVNAAAIVNWNVSKVTNFEHMFFGFKASSMPIFTSRPGTWSDDGTYTPNS